MSKNNRSSSRQSNFKNSNNAKNIAITGSISWRALRVSLLAVAIVVALDVQHCDADVLPFSGAVLSPVPGGNFSTHTNLVSYTTSGGTVMNLSHAVSAEGSFDSSTDDGFRNFYGASDAETPGLTAILGDGMLNSGLDVSTGILNAGDSDDPSTTDDSPNTLAKFFFSQQITETLPGAGNDFFLVDSTGAEQLNVVPLDASGNAIGNFSLDINSTSHWGQFGTLAGTADGVGGFTGNVVGVAFDFGDFDDGAGGTLGGLFGIGIGGTVGVDVSVVGVNSALAPLSSIPQPMLHVNRTTGEIALENTGPSALDILGYEIISEQGALDIDNWLPIAGNKDANGDGTIDPNDVWTQLSSTGNATNLSEFTFLGDGGTLGAGQTLVLSQGDGVWIPWFNEDDLQMNLSLADGNGTVVTVPIVYDGNNGATLLRSDLDHDGDIDEADWSILAAGSYTDLSGLSTVQAYAQGDINFDGVNDIYDFDLFLADAEAFGGAALLATFAGNPVPEPSSLGLLGICFATALFARQQQRS